jgi:hypothetical protein
MKHIHHIVPKYAGGTDEPSNLIELSVEEHAEAHRLLYEQHGHWQDYCAWQALSGRIGKEEILRMKQGMANKGKKRTPEQRERIRQAALIRSARHRADGTLEKANKKRSETLKGRVKTAEHIKNNTESRKRGKGYKISEETKKKISDTLKNKTV